MRIILVCLRGFSYTRITFSFVKKKKKKTVSFKIDHRLFVDEENITIYIITTVAGRIIQTKTALIVKTQKLKKKKKTPISSPNNTICYLKV